ncbi:MAG: hemin uptake protein HemP [Rhodocyclaceae bacterium]
MEHEPVPASQHSPHLALDGAGRLVSQMAGRCVSSEQILGGESSITIEHGDTRYVLRSTRSGKLILTK